MVENTESAGGQLQQLRFAARSFSVAMVASSDKAEGQRAWLTIVTCYKGKIIILFFFHLKGESAHIFHCQCYVTALDFSKILLNKHVSNITSELSLTDSSLTEP